MQAGADCVYFGLSEFNARARAENFDVEELPGRGLHSSTFQLNLSRF